MKRVNISKCKKISCLAAALLLSLNLTGCAITDNFKKMDNFYSDDTYTSVEENSNVSSDNSKDNTTSSDSKNDDKVVIVSNDSYNKLLYDVKTDLSTVFTPNMTDIYNTSKQTDNADRRLDKNDYSSYVFSKNNASYEKLVNAIKNYDVKYTYADLYNVDEALRKVSLDIDSVTHNDYFKKNELNKSNLVSKIKLNNEAYLKEFPELYSLSDSVIDEFAGYVIDEFNSQKDNFNKNDLERIYCALSDLKVVGIDSANREINPTGSIVNAFLGSDGAVLIDEKQIAKIKVEDGKEKTYKHEIMHIFQRTCQHQWDENYRIIGPSELWNDLKVNSRFWNFVYEGSSESLVMHEYNATNAVVYKNYVSYVRSLDLALMLNDENDHEAVEHSTFNVGPDNFFNLFGEIDEKNKKEIINMMYSIDYVQTERLDFEEAYKDNNKGNIIEDYLKVKYDMKSSSCLTISKYFYMNLANAINNGNVTLNDIFYCINVFEEDLNTHLTYDDNSDQDIVNANKYFLSNYIKLQDLFFEYLSTSYNCSVSDIEELFSTYGLVKFDDNNYQRNANLEWLSNDEQKFMGDLLTHNLNSLTTNIRFLYNEDGISKSLS